MPSTNSTFSEVILQRVRTRYRWPAVALNFWIFIILVGASVNLGVFSNFLTVQSQLGLGSPWYFAYWVTVATLTLVFLIIMLYLISQRQLLPGIVIMGTFILFVLWLVGLIVVSAELWGSDGTNDHCSTYVKGVKGASMDTLAYLEQRSICQAWQAAWAFQLVGVIFLLWIMIMAYQVYMNTED